MAAAPAGSSDAADQAVAERIVARSGSSFYWGMRALAPAKRQAMFAVYAFCREVDDIADEPGTMPVKLSRLDGWRADIKRLYAGETPQAPVARALRAPVAQFDLRKDDFLAVIAGMEMDAADRLRIRDMDELTVYCDRVACAVGRLSVRIFGLPQPLGDELADSQGRALQLTNILRDLQDDAARDRLYLPRDRLRTHGIKETEPDAVLANPALAAVCEDLAERACAYFAAADRAAAQCDRKAVRPARMMMEVYRRTLQALIARGWRRWHEPVALSPAAKLWVALRYGLI
ncbi:MAG: presqualene diphosphate synthase HpnD [Defluviicoccus sp.]